MSDDLNTEIKIGADASGVEAGVAKAKRSLKDLGESAKKTGKEAGDGVGSIGAGGDKAARDIDRATKSMQGSLQRLLAEQKAGEKGSREYYEALADTRGISRNAIKPILDQIDAAKKKTLAASDAANSWKSNLARIGPAVAAAFSAAAIGNFVGKVVSVQREFDVLNSSLKTVTGSSAAAEREMAWLKDFAKETPFGLAQATQGFVKMKALGLDPTRAALTSFGNTASAMGKDLNQMIEAVADASTGEFERLKEFGIKASKQGDKVSLTFQGITKTIGNSASEITKYLEDIGNTQFSGAMEERAKTLDGTIAALGDTWDELFRTVSTNNVGGFIFDSVTLANGAIEDATTILKAMGGAASDAGKGTGALATIQSGLATVFETVAVVGANVKYVLTQVGNEVGGLAAQVAQAAQFNFSGVAAIRAQMVSDAQAARKEIDATTDRILNARKEQERYNSYATRNASAATDPRRLDLGGASGAAAAASTAKAVKAAVSEYDKLIKKLGEEIPKAAAEAEAAQNGYNKSQTEFIALANSPAWAKFTNNQRANVAALFATKITSESAADATKALNKANEDAAKSREKYLTSLDAGLDKIQADTAAQIAATERLGLSKDAIAALDSAKLEMLATDTELQAIKALDRNLDEQTYNSLKKQATAYRELAKAKQQGAAKETALDLDKASTEAAKKALQEWEKGLEEVDKLGRDVFANWATEGGNAAEKIGKALKSALLSAIYDATLKKVNVGIYSAIVGDKPGAGGGGGALGAINSASNLNSFYGAASQYFTGASVGASAASLVGANAVGAVGGDALGALIAGNGGWAGVAAGAEAAGAAAGTAAGAGATAGVSAALAAIPVWGWVALAALAVVGLSDGPTSTRSTGYANRKYGADGKLLSSATDGNGIGEAGGVLDGIYKSIAGVQASLGAKGGADITYNSNTGRESKDPQFYLKIGSYDSGEIAKNDANVSLAISRTILTAIQDSELPKYLQGAFDGMVAGSMSQEQINAAIQGGQALKTFNDQLLALPFANLADLSFSATQNLIGFSGGLEQLGANLGAYYTNFYNAEEQRAQTVKNINAATAGSGLDAATATREQFRSIVESQDLATESGQRMYAALLGVSAAFAGITPAAMDASQAINDAAAAADKYASDQATLRLSLERKLLELQGDSAAIRLLEIKGMDDANVALFDRIDALGKEKAASEAASESARALASANQSVRDRIDLLTGAQTDRSITLRDTPDVSTRTLLSELYNTEDLKAANDAVTAAENTLADARRASADIAADAAQRLIEQSLDSKRALAEASQSAAQDLTKELQAVFDTLQSSVRDLYRDVLSTAAMGAVAGQQFIDSALANARASGYLPDNKALGDAISAARGGMGDNQYATVFDRDRDRLVLAGKLSELARIAEPQLSAAEQALQLAKSQLDELADQTTLARKLADKVDAVPAALQKLQDALIAQTQAQTATLAASLVAVVATGSTKPQDAIKQFEDKTGVGVARDAWINAGGTQVYASAGGAIAVGSSAASGVVPTDPSSAAIYGTQGQQTTVGDAQAFIAQALAKGDGKSIYDAAVAYGISSAAVDALGGFAPGSAAAWAAEHKLPAFAVGTNYVPSDMVAQIHEGEAIVPKAYNPAANPGMGTGNTERLERLVEGLTAEVQRLQSIVRDGNENTRQLADQFDNVTEGGNATRTVAV